MSQARKRPWLAAVLSFVFPGVGQLYLRAWSRAVLWLVLVFTIPVTLLATGSLPTTTSITATMRAVGDVSLYVRLLMLGLTALSTVDAYMLAVRHNERVQASERGVDSEVGQCPSCGHDLEDPEIGFCPWCAEQLDPDEPETSRTPW